ncbi:helix-turn-helix domain-containing protein [Agrobacterium sp. CCNWLW32]|uniref:helix-turn-helix domain-containing protein n=1 Tax=Agrobacterium sp. CCNWLW32 TaxID=3122072 RepID=UPI003010015B
MAKTMDPAYFVAWRKKMGLTQAQFASKSGDHLVTVKRWETGARKLPPHIGWIMAAIEHGLEPVGQEAMFEVTDNREPPNENARIPILGKDRKSGLSDWVYPREIDKKPDDENE